MRPTREETLLGIAELWAKRSTCPRAQVGCVIVDSEGHVLSSGFNGAPHGMPHCTDVGCLLESLDLGGPRHCIRALHAEANALISAARAGTALWGGAIYVTVRPCIRCTMMLIQAGITTIVFQDAYDSDDATVWEELVLTAGIDVVLSPLR